MLSLPSSQKKEMLAVWLGTDAEHDLCDMSCLSRASVQEIKYIIIYQAS